MGGFLAEPESKKQADVIECFASVQSKMPKGAKSPYYKPDDCEAFYGVWIGGSGPVRQDKWAWNSSRFEIPIYGQKEFQQWAAGHPLTDDHRCLLHLKKSKLYEPKKCQKQRKASSRKKRKRGHGRPSKNWEQSKALSRKKRQRGHERPSKNWEQSKVLSRKKRRRDPKERRKTTTTQAPSAVSGINPWVDYKCSHPFPFVCQKEKVIRNEVKMIEGEKGEENDGSSEKKGQNGVSYDMCVQNSCYAVVFDNKTWHEAKEICVRTGGKLIEIPEKKDMEVITCLVHLILMKDESIDALWIGGMDLDINTWIWTTSGRTINMDKNKCKDPGMSDTNAFEINQWMCNDPDSAPRDEDQREVGANYCLGFKGKKDEATISWETKSGRRPTFWKDYKCTERLQFACQRMRVHGGWSAWTAFSECSAFCGGHEGVVVRTRACNNPPPKYQGNHCDGPSNETYPCKGKPCFTRSPTTTVHAEFAAAEPTSILKKKDGVWFYVICAVFLTVVIGGISSFVIYKFKVVNRQEEEDSQGSQEDNEVGKEEGEAEAPETDLGDVRAPSPSIEPKKGWPGESEV